VKRATSSDFLADGVASSKLIHSDSLEQQSDGIMAVDVQVPLWNGDRW
jgi:hypothetical protein